MVGRVCGIHSLEDADPSRCLLPLFQPGELRASIPWLR